MNQTTVQKKTYVVIATISVLMLLCAAVVVPTLSVYADHGNQHKKGPKDSDHDGDKDNNGKHLGCINGKHLGNDKYKKECDDNKEFK